MWHTICTISTMPRHDAQSASLPFEALPSINTPPKASPKINTTAPYQFSDATKPPPLSPADPRYLLAIMTQTRHQCRADGLIKRDHAELIHIAQTQGISKVHTRQIIQLVQSTTTLSDHQLRTLATIPINPLQKKTRIPIRVLVGLSIWAITIVVAMQMV